MTSQEPSGAVDSDYDDAAKGPEERLTKHQNEYPSTIRGGDIVIDLVEGRPLYVRQSKGTAIDVFERDNFDLTTYKVHPWLPIRPDDTVYECVFLPTKPADIPSKKKSQTYDYPRGRLARVPVEWLYDSNTHRHAQHTIDTLARLFENADADYRQAVADVAVDTFGEEWVDFALEVAGFEPSNYGADAVERGQIPDDADERPIADVSSTPDPKGSTGEDGEDGELGDFESDL